MRPRLRSWNPVKSNMKKTKYDLSEEMRVRWGRNSMATTSKLWADSNVITHSDVVHYSSSCRESEVVILRRLSRDRKLLL